jgi:hypothetical protein
MLVIRAGTPNGSKLAESDLMKAPARVVAPMYRNVSMATRRKRRE